MRKVTPLLFASLLGILFVVFINLSTRSVTLSGIVLPFGYDGPHYWALNIATDHSWGLPFAMFDYHHKEGAYYTSSTALGMNLASGVGLGIIAAGSIKKFKRTAK